MFKPKFEVRNPACAVWLGNMKDLSHADLQPVMQQAGKCNFVHVGSNGSGFANFSSPDEAQLAISMLNGTNINGKSIQVDVYSSKKTPGQSSGNSKGGKGWAGKGGGGNNTSMVLQTLLKQMKGGAGGGWSAGGGKGKSFGGGSSQTKKPKDTSGGELGEFLGVIKSNAPKYGFITCEALQEAGYQDVFILGDEMKAYTKGQKVKFTAYLDGEGRLQGKDLKSGLK